jgi:hypothetical protein
MKLNLHVPKQYYGFKTYRSEAPDETVVDIYKQPTTALFT